MAIPAIIVVIAFHLLSSGYRERAFFFFLSLVPFVTFSEWIGLQSTPVLHETMTEHDPQCLTHMFMKQLAIQKLVKEYTVFEKKTNPI